MTYAVLSDLHAHTWTQFGFTEADGVNNRLRIILTEMERAADVLKASGGSVMILAGDLFHTRGVMDPEVLNPVRATIDYVMGLGIDIYAIPGNHDLKTRDTKELSSAIQNLSQIGLGGGSFTVCNEPFVVAKGEETSNRKIVMIPWRDTKEDLFKDLTAMVTKIGDIYCKDVDVFIHAGIAGVLTGPTTLGEITPAELSAFGFGRVFAGHYHNHAILGGGIYSIGATTHHNWGDVGTRAGFLLVDQSSVHFQDTKAPKFVDLSGLDELDMELSCPNNYVRFRGPAMTNEEMSEFREQLRTWGAVGTSIEVPRTTAVSRSTTPAKGMTLKQSISKFVADGEFAASVTKEEIEAKALEILDLSQAVVEEA